ncbi:hypothetical protein ATANTOWER_008817 [Ataeniobius toweri]|uniref:Uncharacterized protein n=1 Tax=Ataeniobius toweri TaxID=208326 RepID=A0ABU7AN32_9TELE|nr:hypothetical protein [Ataeniobius toweri]
MPGPLHACAPVGSLLGSQLYLGTKAVNGEIKTSINNKSFLLVTPKYADYRVLRACVSAAGVKALKHLSIWPTPYEKWFFVIFLRGRAGCYTVCSYRRQGTQCHAQKLWTL